MLTVAPAELKARGRRLLQRLRKMLPAGVKVSLTSGFSQAGGGAFPLLELPTTLMAVEMERVSPHQLESRLRNCAVPVLGRICKERFLLDLRTILDADVASLVTALRSLEK
jgi:L-seryl-tRNA(Ser) seleniumtransferase